MRRTLTSRERMDRPQIFALLASTRGLGKSLYDVPVFFVSLEGKWSGSKRRSRRTGNGCGYVVAGTALRSRGAN